MIVKSPRADLHSSDPPPVKRLEAFECTHCGLPVPAGLLDESREEQFCCHGCEGAYQLIQAHGLESFYDMAAPDQDARSLRDRLPKSHRFAEFDRPAFAEKFIRTRQIGDGTETENQIILAVDGMHCAACIWLIEKLPSMIVGVHEARVSWSRRSVTLRWNPAVATLSKVAQTLAQLGYPAYPIRQSDRVAQFQRESRNHLSRIGVAGALAGNNMVISAALYLGLFSHMTADMTQLLRIASCLVGVAALLFPGRVFLRSAVNAIAARLPHMDLPIALALLAGTIAGTINVIRGAGEIYFDSLAVLIFLLLIGRWLQFRQQSKAADAVELLYQMTPQTTWKIVDGQPVEIMVDLVEVGDRLEIRSGDLFPVDGVVVQGKTEVDESILTGESVAVAKSPSDEVSAGTTNLSSPVAIEVRAIGSDTRLAKIVELVEQSSHDKPPIVQWANAIGGYFVAAVMLLACLTLWYWLPINFETGLDRTIALLIVACPCALALATPLALSIALGRAAKRRIMIKGGDVLQCLQKPGMLWLDKTGTLTEGELKVARWYGDTSWLRQVSILERRSSHPVGKALLAYCQLMQRRKLNGFDVVADPDVVDIPGMGISATLEGCRFLIGNRALLERENIAPSVAHRRIAERLLNQGYSPCWIAKDNKVVGIAAIADSIREEAFDAIAELKKRGWDVGILSGDHPQVVERVAKRLGIDSQKAIGRVGPEEKLQRVQRSSESGNVVMVGDGVNDSAALAAATVGIAVKHGAEASLAAAPVYLAKPGLNPLLELMAISDSTASTMRFNLGVSLAYNITFAALALAGMINPLVAAILMPVSSLTVVSLSFRSGRTRRDRFDRSMKENRK